MLRCTTNRYAQLYARWLRQPSKLLDIGGFTPGMRVLDLCGGTGLVAQEALCRGASFALVADLNPRTALPAVTGRVEDLLTSLRLQGYREQIGEFDLVICRQAINYLPLMCAARVVHQVLRPGGRFVFNTFAQPRWFAKTYRYAGRRYFEAAGHLGGQVVHLQASPSLGVDVSTFRWYPTAILLRIMRLFFDVELRREGSSIYVRCTKESTL